MHLLLPSDQLWVLIIGAVLPLPTYALNKWAPWVSEPVKAAVHVAVAAVGAGLYTAIATHVFGWNSATLELVFTGVVGALTAHQFLWKPSLIATLFGAGQNKLAVNKARPQGR